MRFSFNILCALIICSGINFMNAMSNKDITILPINNAKFLAGQRFDFLVEIRDSNLNLANTRVAIRVTINDKNITEYFNKSPKIWRDGDIVSYRIDFCIF